MSRALRCPRCLRPLAPGTIPAACPTCGKSLPQDDPRVLQGRSSAGARRDDDEDEDYADAGDDYDDDLPRPRRSKRRTADRPGKVQAVAIMTLIGGIVAVLYGLMWLGVDASSCGITCLWPGQYYAMVLGIMGLIKGSQLLGSEAHLQPPPRAIGIMMIINIINGDIANCVMGILVLVFCSDPEVENFFARA